MNNIKNYIRTHTYWMTVKEYKKRSKYRLKHNINNSNVITRTHIYFV